MREASLETIEAVSGIAVALLVIAVGAIIAITIYVSSERWKRRTIRRTRERAYNQYNRNMQKDRYRGLP